MTCFARGGIWLPQDIWPPLGTPLDNRGKCHMDEQRFFACQTHRSMYPSIFNRFPVIQPVSLKVRHFSTFSPPWVRPWTIAVNVAWMERGFNAGQTNRSMYPSIFNRLRAIARYWSEITTFSYPHCI